MAVAKFAQEWKQDFGSNAVIFTDIAISSVISGMSRFFMLVLVLTGS